MNQSLISTIACTMALLGGLKPVNTSAQVAPILAIGPVSQGVIAGESMSFSAYFFGQPDPVYQWFFNGTPVLNETNSSLPIVKASATNLGEYLVVATNELGSVTSRVATLTLTTLGPVDRWEWRHPTPQGNDLFDAAYGDARLVVVGRKGSKALSTDGGATWRMASQDSASLYAVTYGNSLFVAVGGNRGRAEEGPPIAVQTSPDGLRWTDHSPTMTNLTTLTDVDYGAGVFVAVGGGRSILLSRDGIHWQESDPGLGYNLSKVHFSGERFIAAGDAIAASADGSSWTNLALARVSDAADGNALLIGSRAEIWERDCDGCPRTRYSLVQAWLLIGPAPGGVAVQTLSDGVFPVATLAFGNGRFVLAGSTASPVLYSSEDGVNWFDHSQQATDKLLGVRHIGDGFVAVGNHGTIITSLDGFNWSARNSTSPRNFRSVLKGGGIYVATGNDGLLMTSPDARTWAYQSVPTSNNLRGVAFKDGLYVAVGEPDAFGATLLVSSNAVSWRRWYVNIDNGLYDITVFRNQFVAVGDNGEVLVSPEGRYWFSYQVLGAPRLNAVIATDDLIVAVGRNGAVLTSSDATHWTQHSITFRYFQAVAYGNRTFVAMGRSGALVVSTNGSDWVEYPTAFRRDIEDLCFAAGLFVAVGEDGFTATSPDGIIWTQRRSRCQDSLRGVIYADSRFLAVGNNEIMLQSGFSGPPILHLSGQATRDGFSFLVEGEPDRDYWLQGSDDLQNWENFMFFNNRQETTFFLDPDSVWYPRRYYRVFGE